MRASQMRSKNNRSVNAHRQIVRCASVKSAGASGLRESDFIPNGSDRELVASFNVDGKWLDCLVVDLSNWDVDDDDSGYCVYVIDDPDGNEVASSGQDSWTSMDDAIDSAIERCDDIAENPDGYKLSKASQMRAKRSDAYDCNRSMNRRASASSRLGGLNPDVRRLPKTAHGRAFASKNAPTSNKKTAYDYNECFDIVDDMTHETFDYLRRQQRISNGRLTEDRLFTLAKGYIYDRLNDDQLIDLYRYFNGEGVDVLHDGQAARVVDAIAYMVMDHVDEGLDDVLHMGGKKASNRELVLYRSTIGRNYSGISPDQSDDISVMSLGSKGWLVNLHDRTDVSSNVRYPLFSESFRTLKDVEDFLQDRYGCNVRTERQE